MKKLNLMPSEFKAAEIMRLVRQVAVLVALIPIGYLIYLGVLNYKMYNDIKVTEEKIQVVENLERSVNNMNNQIQSKQLFLESLSKSEFELNNFVKFLNSEVGDDLNIISVDSEDRLIGRPVDIVVATEIPEEEPDGEEIEEVAPPVVAPTYSNKMKLVIRGYSNNSVSIADFVYKLSLLDFIGDVNLTAIEEKDTPDGISNVFEIKLDVK